MKYEDIKFFSERCEEHPDHQTGMVSHQMIQDRLSEEVDELRAYIESQLAQPEQEPVAIRYDFDGYGYKYMDSGSGSDWQKRVQGELLYTAPPQIKVGCAECGVGGGHALYCVECAEKFVGLENENRSILIRTLKWCEDLLREAGHDEAVSDVQDCIMQLRKSQNK